MKLIFDKKVLKFFTFKYIFLWQTGIFQIAMFASYYNQDLLLKPASENSIIVTASSQVIFISQFSETEKVIYLLGFKLNNSFSASSFDFSPVNSITDISIVKNQIKSYYEVIQKTIPRSPPFETI